MGKENPRRLPITSGTSLNPQQTQIVRAMSKIMTEHSVNPDCVSAYDSIDWWKWDYETRRRVDNLPKCVLTRSMKQEIQRIVADNSKV